MKEARKKEAEFLCEEKENNSELGKNVPARKRIRLELASDDETAVEETTAPKPSKVSVLQ